MRMIVRDRGRWLVRSLAGFAIAGLLARLLDQNLLFDLAVGLAASGWILGVAWLREPSADLAISVAQHARGRDELVTVAAVSRGRLPVTIARVGFCADRSTGSCWWATLHPVWSEVPGRPLHHGYGATFAVNAAAVAVETEDPRWVCLEDSTGDLYWAPVPAEVRQRLANIRFTTTVLARYRVLRGDMPLPA
jgi:hypothetical protein